MHTHKQTQTNNYIYTQTNTNKQLYIHTNKHKQTTIYTHKKTTTMYTQTNNYVYTSMCKILKRSKAPAVYTTVSLGCRRGQHNHVHVHVNENEVMKSLHYSQNYCSACLTQFFVSQTN